MLLLSTAADLYWLGRYLSRTQALLSALLQAFNEPTRDNLTIPLSMTATGAYYYQQYNELKEAYIAAFFMDIQNSSSLSYCINALRSDAQATRGRLSQELWLAINTLYLDWQAAALTQKDFSDVLQRHQKLQTQLHELTVCVDVEPDTQVKLFVKIGLSIEVLDNMMRYSLIKYNGDFDVEDALQQVAVLQQQLAQLPNTVWGQVTEGVNQLQQAISSQPQAFLMQQHLQNVTKALSDVFAN